MVKLETQSDYLLLKAFGYGINRWPYYVPDNDRQSSPYFHRKNELTIEQEVFNVRLKMSSSGSFIE